MLRRQKPGPMSAFTDRLRQVAGQATRGPWAPLQDPDGYWWAWVEGVEHYAGVAQANITDGDDLGREQADAEHIATFDPVLVERMLDVIDAAEQLDTTGDWDDLLEALARFREVAG